MDSSHNRCCRTELDDHRIGDFPVGCVAATANSGLDLTFGGTSCAFDATVNNFFTFTKTLSVAGAWTTLYCYIYALN